MDTNSIVVFDAKHIDCAIATKPTADYLELTLVPDDCDDYDGHRILMSDQILRLNLEAIMIRDINERVSRDGRCDRVALERYRDQLFRVVGHINALLQADAMACHE